MVKSFILGPVNLLTVHREKKAREETSWQALWWQVYGIYHEKPTMPEDLGPTSQLGIGRLFYLPSGTTMNGENYVQLLSDKLQLHMQVYRRNIFM